MHKNRLPSSWNHPTGIIVFIVAALGLAACAEPVTATKAESPAKVDGSRVILTAKAAQRLGIQTVPLREERVILRRRVGGDVVAAPDRPLVRVPVLASTMGQVDFNQSALIVPRTDLAAATVPTASPGTGTAGASAVAARSVPAPPGASARDVTPTLYYAVDSAQPALTAGQRVLVDIPLRSSGALRKVVPYAAVLYGLRGETWTFVRTEPLVFVRQPITVEYIQGDLAVLTDGPAAGTAVVTVGGAELFGIETGIGK